VTAVALVADGWVAAGDVLERGGQRAYVTRIARDELGNSFPVVEAPATGRELRLPAPKEWRRAAASWPAQGGGALAVLDRQVAEVCRAAG
jgi:hypothetical protein